MNPEDFRILSGIFAVAFLAIIVLRRFQRPHSIRRRDPEG